MRALLSAEFLRLRSRKLPVMLLVIGVAVAALVGVFAFTSSQKPVDDAQVEKRRAQCLEQIRRGGRLDPRIEEQTCSNQFVGDRRFRLASALPDITRGVARQLLPVLAVVMGASLIGAEWASGNMQTLLTWEPRRGRVLAAKLAAGGAAAFVGAVVVLLLLVAAVMPATLARGTAAGANGSFWWSMAGLWLRGGFVAASAALIGMTLASIARNTAAPIVLWFLYGIAESLIGLWRNGKLRPLLLSENLNHVLGLASFGSSGRFSTMAPRSALAATGVVLCYLAVVTGAAYATFISKDI
ncbi:MAG TPA: ABC transporter permease [Actinomycetota bacterium]|nr:ABC transporter permease [Actinomycetota bacterium]